MRITMRSDLSVTMLAAITSPWVMLNDLDPSTVALVVKLAATVFGPACTLVAWRLLRAGSSGVRRLAEILRARSSAQLEDDDPANDLEAQRGLIAAEVLESLAEGLEHEERRRVKGKKPES
jgi:hypothetical protein